MLYLCIHALLGRFVSSNHEVGDRGRCGSDAADSHQATGEEEGKDPGNCPGD
jgi:hypothetical protein